MPAGPAWTIYQRNARARLEESQFFSRIHPMQAQERYLPDPNRVGVLAAAVLLTYALTRLVNAPGFTLAIQLPGFYLSYPFTLGTAMTLMAAGLTATGMDWLLGSHPSFQGKNTLEHWLLPALTAFIVGVLLDNLPPGSVWWVGFAVGGGLLTAVILAEYVALDPGAPLYALASAGLTALSYTLFLLFVIALRIGGARLFLSVPAVFLAAGFVTLRTLHLRSGGRWEFAWGFGIALVCAQLAAGLHYWPLTSLQLGIILLGPLYALTALAYSLGQDIPLRSALAEPGIILGALWAIAIFLR
jgi:hypothetical protein